VGALSVDGRRLSSDRLSVRLFVSCLTLSRERNGLGSLKLAIGKSMTRATHDII